MYTLSTISYYVQSWKEKWLSKKPCKCVKKYFFCIKRLHITENLVLMAIKHVNPNKSQGPDSFHPKLIKETQNVICKPLTTIYQKSFNEAKIQQIWKCANDTAIFKNGNRSKPTNYIPISLTSVPGKIMDRIIRDKLVDHMNRNNLFCIEQHGFIKGKSCVTQLLEFMEVITEAIDQGTKSTSSTLIIPKPLIRSPTKGS